MNQSVSRKEKRAEQKKLKRVKRAAYNAKKPVLSVMKQLLPSEESTSAKPVPLSKQARKKAKRRRAKQLADEEAKKHPNEDVDRQKDKNDYNEKSIERTRVRELRELAKEDEIEAKRMLKQLGYKKRKSNTLPGCFVRDNLNYILDVCDSDRIETLIESTKAESKEPPIKKKKTRVDDSDEEEEEASESDQSESEESDSNEDEPMEAQSSDQEQNDAEPSGAESGSEPELTKAKTKRPKQDIYGREITKTESGPRFIAQNPQGAAEKLKDLDEKQSGVDNVELERLTRKIRGLVNRVSEPSLQSSLTELNNLYTTSSRNDVRKLLVSSLMRTLCVGHALTERMLMDYAAFLTLVHHRMHALISAYVLESVCCKVRELHNDKTRSLDDRSFDNLLLFLCRICRFKVIKASLMFDILNFLLDSFDDNSVQSILLILKDVGFQLRKDEPQSLKNFISATQQKAAEKNKSDKGAMSSVKVGFMLDALLAIKNNNMNKLTQTCDMERLEHLVKLTRALLKQGERESPLAAGLQDYWNAETAGRYWIVGAAWTQHSLTNGQHKLESNKKSAASDLLSQFPADLLRLAEQQRMNTDTKRAVFCSIMSAEDDQDAVERVLRLGLKGSAEYDIVTVTVLCCLRERKFNSYYALLLTRLIDLHRKYMTSARNALRDRLRQSDTLQTFELKNLADLIIHLIANHQIQLSVLKVIDFTVIGAEMTGTKRLLRRVFTGLLKRNESDVKTSFKKTFKVNKEKLSDEQLQQQREFSTGLQMYLETHLRPFFKRKHPGLSMLLEELLLMISLN